MSEPEKKFYEVSVAGYPLKLRSSHDEETVQQLVGLVDKKVREAWDTQASVSFQSALLLASLHLAEDSVLLKRSALKELELIEDQAQDILSDLESSPVSRVKLDN